MMNQFVAVSPSDCPITYSCNMTAGPEGYDLCSYNEGLTETSFDLYTGNYQFSSYDFELFGSQFANFTITGTAGSLPNRSTRSIDFSM